MDSTHGGRIGVIWNKGYTASYYMAIVDPFTWCDLGRVEMTGGSVERQTAGLRQSASIDCKDYPAGIEQYVRVWMDVTQDGGGYAHEAVFTGLASTPGRKYKGIVSNATITGYSVLKPCEDIVLLPGWYAPKGQPAGDILRRLLQYTPAPVTIAEGSPALYDHIIADEGERVTSMIDKILTAINWRLIITGKGEIVVEPKPTEAAATMDTTSADIVEPEIEVEEDYFAAPNVFMVIAEDITAIARDETGGQLSIAERGREVWQVETSADLAATESVEEYAARMLKEAQAVQQTGSYSRRYLPDIYPGDRVDLRLPAQELNGIYEVVTQSITLGFAARTVEAVKIITRSE